MSLRSELDVEFSDGIPVVVPRPLDGAGQSVKRTLFRSEAGYARHSRPQYTYFAMRNKPPVVLVEPDTWYRSNRLRLTAHTASYSPDSRIEVVDSGSLILRKPLDVKTLVLLAVGSIWLRATSPFPSTKRTMLRRHIVRASTTVECVRGGVPSCSISPTPRPLDGVQCVQAEEHSTSAMGNGGCEGKGVCTWDSLPEHERYRSWSRHTETGGVVPPSARDTWSRLADGSSLGPAFGSGIVVDGPRTRLRLPGVADG